MTLPDKNTDWEWVVKPEEGATYQCKNTDLSGAIVSGNRICELRMKTGLSAQEVEDYAGVPKASLLALEAGLLKLDAETAELLAMVFGVSIAELND